MFLGSGNIKYCDEHMRLLHRDVTLRFACLPADLRREYLGPMLLGQWRVVCGDADGRLLLGCGVSRVLSGLILGTCQSVFVVVSSQRVLAWGSGELEFWRKHGDNWYRYGFYNHSMPLLGQAAITCAARSHSIQAGQLQRNDENSFSVFRPNMTGTSGHARTCHTIESGEFTPDHFWDQWIYKIPNVPSEFAVVLCRRRDIITEFVLWDGSYGLIRVFVPECTSRRAFRLHRVPVCVTEAADTEAVHLTYAWGDGLSVRFEDMEKM